MAVNREDQIEKHDHLHWHDKADHHTLGGYHTHGHASPRGPGHHHDKLETSVLRDYRIAQSISEHFNVDFSTAVALLGDSASIGYTIDQDDPEQDPDDTYSNWYLFLIYLAREKLCCKKLPGFSIPGSHEVETTPYCVDKWTAQQEVAILYKSFQVHGPGSPLVGRDDGTNAKKAIKQFEAWMEEFERGDAPAIDVGLPGPWPNSNDLGGEHVEVSKGKFGHCRSIQFWYDRFDYPIQVQYGTETYELMTAAQYGYMPGGFGQRCFKECQESYPCDGGSPTGGCEKQVMKCVPHLEEIGGPDLCDRSPGSNPLTAGGSYGVTDPSRFPFQLPPTPIGMKFRVSQPGDPEFGTPEAVPGRGEWVPPPIGGQGGVVQGLGWHPFTDHAHFHTPRLYHKHKHLPPRFGRHHHK